MLGHRISLLRSQKGLSQAELACKLHVSASAIGMYEQGRREPSLETVVLLAQEFEVTTDYLLTGRRVSRQDILSFSKSFHYIHNCFQSNIRALLPRQVSADELATIAAMLLSDEFSAEV